MEPNELAQDQDNPGEAQDAPSTEELGLPATPVVDESNLDFDSVEAMLSLDPITGEKPPASDGGKEEQSAPAAQQDAQPTSSEPGTPTEDNPGTEEPPAAEADPEKELLKNQIAEMQAKIDALQKPAEPAPAAPGGENSNAEAAVPEYAFQIPDQLMTLMESEDPVERRQGYAQLIQGTAQVVHAQVLQAVGEQYQRGVPAIVHKIVAEQALAKQVFDDFYGKYPTLNKPELRDFIKNTALEVGKTYNAKEWTPALRDAIAKRAFDVLGQTPGSVPATPPATPPAKPAPANFDGKTRGATPVTEGGINSPDDISKVLFG